MNSYNYIKHVIRRAANYTLGRITFYLTLFNFFMLANWMYESSSFGETIQSFGLRPGDIVLVFLFIIFAISALEYVVLGRDKEVEQEQEEANQ